jgi:hypothetical protein
MITDKMLGDIMCITCSSPHGKECEEFYVCKEEIKQKGYQVEAIKEIQEHISIAWLKSIATENLADKNLICPNDISQANKLLKQLGVNND